MPLFITPYLPTVLLGSHQCPLLTLARSFSNQVIIVPKCNQTLTTVNEFQKFRKELSNMET